MKGTEGADSIRRTISAFQIPSRRSKVRRRAATDELSVKFKFLGQYSTATKATRGVKVQGRLITATTATRESAREAEAETEELILMDGSGTGTTSNFMPREGVTNETSIEEFKPRYLREWQDEPNRAAGGRGGAVCQAASAEGRFKAPSTRSTLTIMIPRGSSRGLSTFIDFQGEKMKEVPIQREKVLCSFSVFNGPLHMTIFCE